MRRVSVFIVFIPVVAIGLLASPHAAEAQTCTNPVGFTDACLSVYNSDNSGSATTVAGVFGENDNSGCYGLYGTSNNGIGVGAWSEYAYAISGVSAGSNAIQGDISGQSSGTNSAVFGNAGSVGTGVTGSTTGGPAGVIGTTSTTYGVEAQATGSGGIGLYATASGGAAISANSTGTGPTAYGLYAASTNADTIHAAYGGTGSSTAIEGVGTTSGNGVVGISNNASYYGVKGINDNTNGVAMYGYSNASGATGVWGQSAYNGAGYGVYGEATGITSFGVYGYNTSSGDGVYGTSTSGYGVAGTSSSGYGVYGSASGADGGHFTTSSTSSSAVAGVSSGGSGNSIGVYGATGYSGGYAGWFAGKVNVTGEIYVGSCSGCTSDIRLKKNVKPLEGAIDELLQLKGVTFEWKDPSQHEGDAATVRGFLAQDLEKTHPSWVKQEGYTAPDGQKYKTVDLKQIEALEVESIRFLREKAEKADARADKADARAKDADDRLGALERGHVRAGSRLIPSGALWGIFGVGVGAFLMRRKNENKKTA